jgi:hypothetical protein
MVSLTVNDKIKKKMGSMSSKIDERTQKAGIFIFLLGNVREYRTQFFLKILSLTVSESSSGEKSDKKWK